MGSSGQWVEGVASNWHGEEKKTASALEIFCAEIAFEVSPMNSDRGVKGEMKINIVLAVQ